MKKKEIPQYVLVLAITVIQIDMEEICDPFGVIGGFSMASCYLYATPSG
jgi:hypothetical protein